MSLSASDHWQLGLGLGLGAGPGQPAGGHAVWHGPGTACAADLSFKLLARHWRRLGHSVTVSESESEERYSVT
eukprot:3635212-Rhodomonas_salina.1